MLKRALPTLTLRCLMTGTLFAADDPFVGKWKLNFAKSDIDRDQLKIEDLGGMKVMSICGLALLNSYWEVGLS